MHKYVKHLWTICRFLLKTSFPEEKPPSKDKDKDKDKEAALPKEARDRAARMKPRQRPYATEAQMQLSSPTPLAPPPRSPSPSPESIVQQSVKPMKKLYKAGEKSGQGGFGTVFLAKDMQAKQARVAVKKLPHDNPRTQENNWSEIAFLSMCKHPNICAFLKAYLVKEKDTPDEIWIIMEFLEGGTLSEAARAHRFSDQHIGYVAHEVLMALQYLHGKHLVHRDLKSANVMMSIKGEIKLIDFGLCADFSEGPRVKMLGSPYWIPPEMVWEMPHSYSADIWSPPHPTPPP